MTSTRTLFRLGAALLLAACAVAHAQAPASGNADPRPAPPPASAAPRGLSTVDKPWKGDFDALLGRRMMRVFIPYSRSLYFNDKGTERGLAVELVRDFERYVNRKYAKRLGKRPFTVYVIPATRDRLLPALDEGLSDISVGNLTVTDERMKVADFVGGEDEKPVSEVLVTGPAAPAIATLDDLAGRPVHTRKTSSYYESLVALNRRLESEHKQPVNIILVPEALEDEDMMEMANVGLMQAIVVDDWKARLWAQVLPKIKVRDDLVLRSGGRIAWAIRKDSPELAAEIVEFYSTSVARPAIIEARLAAFMKHVKQLRDPTRSAEWKRFEATRQLFVKYGGQYSFDPLMLAAQGYQESTLDQSKRSPVGAIGVMQLMPETGAEMKVGDITQTEPNVHGGAKYMDQLMTKYFADAKFSATNRALFAFASYNCGAGNVQKARVEAVKRGLDPDKWFNNVEVVIADRIGIETTTYVRNIYKYYVAYRLTAEAAEEERKAREGMTPAR